ncbi:MAG: SAM-dependent methyltransferase [Saprospirales bacterium]|nr:SAM-dependent methyltransferase [Saprospirales bacterium]
MAPQTIPDSSVNCKQSRKPQKMEVIKTQDGSPTIRLEAEGVTYHSRYGAVQESQHVFIEAGLYYKAVTKKELSILEVGFGTGLNTFLTCLEVDRLTLNVHYTALDTKPLPPEIFTALDYAQFLNEPATRELFLQLHQCDWEVETSVTEGFNLLKKNAKAEAWRSENTYDLIYYDAFAPSSQPELWTPEIMQNMYDSLIQGGVLVTYCAKSAFKRALKSAGFEVEALPGPPGKREMTRARK